MFPANHFWNTRIDRAPLHPFRKVDVAMHAGHGFHRDWGTVYAGGKWGIPVNIVGPSTPRRVVKYHPPPAEIYDYESDQMPPEGLPIPDDFVVEGDMLPPYHDPNNENDDGLPTGPHDWPDKNSDHHLILIDYDEGVTHELYSIRMQPDGSFTTGFYGRFPNDNSTRPEGWTSADASGMSIAGALISYDEANENRINHASRFTLDNTSGHEWPARHQTSPPDGFFPPFGTRVRMRADYPIDQEHWPRFADDGTRLPDWDATISPINRAIMQSWKDYGMILADNGGDWFVQQQPDPRWDSDDLQWLNLIQVSIAFECVDNAALMVDPNSCEAKQL